MTWWFWGKRAFRKLFANAKSATLKASREGLAGVFELREKIGKGILPKHEQKERT